MKEVTARSSARWGKRATRGKQGKPAFHDGCPLHQWPLQVCPHSLIPFIASSFGRRYCTYMPATAEANQDLTSATTDTVATSPTSEDVQDNEVVAILRARIFKFLFFFFLFFFFKLSSLRRSTTSKPLERQHPAAPTHRQRGTRSGGTPEETRQPSSGDVPYE